MDRNATIGSRINELRTARKLTLKQLSEASGLSTGFLSQIERGMSSIAIDTLARIAKVFEVSLTSFFDDLEEESTNPVVHGFDLHPTQFSEQIIQYILSKHKSAFNMLPRLFQLMPFANADNQLMSHEGEEFVYILEGIVTVCLESQQYTLYPGDSIQIHSNANHNWMNLTNKLAKLLSINCPNPFQLNQAE